MTIYPARMVILKFCNDDSHALWEVFDEVAKLKTGIHGEKLLTFVKGLVIMLLRERWLNGYSNSCGGKQTLLSVEDGVKALEVDANWDGPGGCPPKGEIMISLFVTESGRWLTRIGAEEAILNLCDDDSYDLWEVLDEVSTIKPDMSRADLLDLTKVLATGLLRKGLLNAYSHLWGGKETLLSVEDGVKALEVDAN